MAYVPLTDEQLKEKKAYIDNYKGEGNAASKSALDANANVTHKSSITLNAELNKNEIVQVNRYLMRKKLEEMFPGEGLDSEYVRQLEEHEIYAHDESSAIGKAYCASVSLYPYIKNGLWKMDGITEAPQHLHSFCGGFINLMTILANNVRGAIGAVELLTYIDHFARRDYGDNYLETNSKELNVQLEQIIYMLNQPLRGGHQSIFWNTSIFDKDYFHGVFDNFVFPNGDLPNWETVNKLQEHFLKFYNNERMRCKGPLTFPVITSNMLTDDNSEFRDEEVLDYISESLSEGNNFFNYISDNVDALSSCCRLKSEIVDNTFSYSLGAGGVSTGSMNVITINLNRCVQRGIDLSEVLDKIYKYQVAFKSILQEYIDGDLLPIYNEGYIHESKQYLTIGINGFVEAAEYLGIDISYNEEYKQFCDKIMKTISTKNKEAKSKYGFMFNTEFVPAENLGAKHSKWDSEDGLKVNRDCYNSYFFRVEDNNISMVDKMKLHGSEFTQYLDGGSACHVNLQEHPSKEQYKQLLRNAAKLGCNYSVFNIPASICNECEKRDKNYITKCTGCGSTNLDYETRVIGYLKRVSHFSQPRQEEASRRVYNGMGQFVNNKEE